MARSARSAGIVVLGLWLLFSGLAALLGLSGFIRPLLAAFAVVAGVLILLGM